MIRDKFVLWESETNLEEERKGQSKAKQQFLRIFYLLGVVSLYKPQKRQLQKERDYWALGPNLLNIFVLVSCYIISFRKANKNTWPYCRVTGTGKSTQTPVQIIHRNTGTTATTQNSIESLLLAFINWCSAISERNPFFFQRWKSICFRSARCSSLGSRTRATDFPFSCRANKLQKKEGLHSKALRLLRPCHCRHQSRRSNKSNSNACSSAPKINEQGTDKN